MNHNQLPELPSDLKSLAANLAALVPAAGNFGRDELMYRAGWEACAVASGSLSPTVYTRAANGRARRLGWIWPLCTAGLVLVSAMLGIALIMRKPEVRLVYVERPERPSAEAKASQPPAVVSTDSSYGQSATVTNPLPARPALDRSQMRPGQEYLSLRQRVLAFGVDVLQSGVAAPSSEDDSTSSDSRYGALISQLRGG